MEASRLVPSATEKLDTPTTRGEIAIRFHRSTAGGVDRRTVGRGHSRAALRSNDDGRVACARVQLCLCAWPEFHSTVRVFVVGAVLWLNGRSEHLLFTALMAPCSCTGVVTGAAVCGVFAPHFNISEGARLCFSPFTFWQLCILYGRPMLPCGFFFFLLLSSFFFLA